MSTMLHFYDDDDDDVEDGSVATFHTARASSFHSTAITLDVFLEHDDDDGATTNESVGGNSDILFSSGFVGRFTSRVHDRVSYGDDQEGSLWLQQYLRGKLLRQLREGDNGSTYLAELEHNGERTLYAIKIIPKDHVRKLTERRVLKSLDHPFLPQVYADVDSVEMAYLVMDFCPRGDLRALLRGNPLREEAAKFYAAEVLLAMEYLHAQGIIHRGLKPENVLIRADGHIMLSGFDHVLQTTTRRFLQHMESEEEGGRGLVVVPEVAKGQEHGAAADWYTYGMLLYELLFGTTPFKEHDGGRMTCINVDFASRRLKFPQAPAVSPAARDLLKRLLKRNPKGRLGRKGGAGEVKRHVFFEGVNFAQMQKMAAGRMRPPQLPIKL